MANVYETLQNKFIEIRYLHSENCFDELRLQVAKNSIENIRKELDNEKTDKHYFLIYCIDNLFNIINEKNRQKIFDFADLIHNMPEVCLGYRDIASFKSEIKYFNNEYESDFFRDFFRKSGTSTLITETDTKYVKLQSKKALSIIFLLTSLFAYLGADTFLSFLLFESIFLIVLLFSMRISNHSWKLEFENDELTATNLKTNKSFLVYDIPASDFVITQTKREARNDYCKLKIRKTIFTFVGIKNCQQLKTYIRENYN